MHQLIASYLFQHKICPLPGLGSLSVNTGNAGSDFVNKQILAPKPAINFETAEINADDFVFYISKQEGYDSSLAKSKLEAYCHAIKEKANAGSECQLYGVGNFFIDGSGTLQFQDAEIPGILLQPVIAERVIHPEAEHNMLVGDKERTNTQMTEYYNEEPVEKDRWWIWAVVLGFFGIVTIICYLNDSSSNASFGIATNISNL